MEILVNIYDDNIELQQMQVLGELKGERKKSLKKCKLTFYAIIFGRRTLFSITKPVF